MREGALELLVPKQPDRDPAHRPSAEHSGAEPTQATRTCDYCVGIAGGEGLQRDHPEGARDEELDEIRVSRHLFRVKPKHSSVSEHQRSPPLPVVPVVSTGSTDGLATRAR